MPEAKTVRVWDMIKHSRNGNSERGRRFSVYRPSVGIMLPIYDAVASFVLISPAACFLHGWFPAGLAPCAPGG